MASDRLKGEPYVHHPYPTCVIRGHSIPQFTPRMGQPGQLRMLEQSALAVPRLLIMVVALRNAGAVQNRFGTEGGKPLSPGTPWNMSIALLPSASSHRHAWRT
jgi:hypothetical protein